MDRGLDFVVAVLSDESAHPGEAVPTAPPWSGMGRKSASRCRTKASSMQALATDGRALNGERRATNARNNLFPPDQRFGVTWPSGMCVTHRQHWLDYRNHRFDPVTAGRWPGGPGSPFIVVGPDLGRVREERRVEWERA